MELLNHTSIQLRAKAPHYSTPQLMIRPR